MHLVEFASTRTIAQKHGISQTRVRQVVQRVSRWLAAALPVKTELEQEQETRLAQHLAADQLRNQLEDLRILWDATHDPKYFRQQTRVITALARLGILPGAIESLAADATTGPLDPTEPQPPWSEDDPWANSIVATPTLRCAVPPQPETWNLKPETSPPPSEDCSPPSAHVTPTPAPHSHRLALPQLLCNPQFPTRSNPFLEDSLEGLKLIEQRLLTLLENVQPDDTERRNSLAQTLKSTQSQRASLEIRLSRTSPPLVVPLQTSATDATIPHSHRLTNNPRSTSTFVSLMPS